MIKIRTIILGCLCLGWGVVDLYSQSSVVVSGGEATGSGGTASYSIGQVVYITVTGSGGTVTQGTQQPYEIFVVSNSIDTTQHPNDTTVVTGYQAIAINLIAVVYPNPTTDFLTLDINNGDVYQTSYALFNLHGKLIAKQIITGVQTIISLGKFSNGTYLLKVLKNNREIKTFKIIKNQ